MEFKEKIMLQCMKGVKSRVSLREFDLYRIIFSVKLGADTSVA